MISGFTFIKDGVRFDFPFEECIKSILPLVDELIVNVGIGEDETLQRVQKIAATEKRIRVLQNTWDEKLRQEGKVLAEQTNLAINQCQGEWGIYLQADEVLHEADHDLVRKAIAKADADPKVDGVLFDYLHFYGDFSVLNRNPSAYRHEVRAIRLKHDIYSYKDAQGFRKKTPNGEVKLNVISSKARIFHYGWVRPQTVMQEKTVAMDKLYHPDGEGTGENYKYKRIFGLQRFKGNHPQVMHERISKAKDWGVDVLKLPLVFSAKDFRKLPAYLLECLTGWLPFQYKNYWKVG